MRYISIFSGIEAASVAWEPLGWEPVAFAEIEPFPCAVLAERFPNVPNLGSVIDIDWSKYNDGSVDVIVGGSPCQSFSIAGKREGLHGESGLMFEYIRAVREVRPRYFIWENVPGAFSSEKGAAFHQLLREMDELGYGMAWRVLDAQFFGVAQRRRRVFLVGSLGNQSAAEILFEPDSLRWDIESSREKRQELTRAAADRASEGVGADCLTSWDTQSARVYSQDGVWPTLYASSDKSGLNRQSVLCMASGMANAEIGEDMAPTQTARQYKDPQILCMTQYGEEVAGTLTARHDSSPCADRGQSVLCMADDNAKAAIDFDMCGSLKVGGSAPIAASGYVVRRLTPRECERLQGFPDDWTLIDFKGKGIENCPDAPRYKALGNSMAVPVMRWIGRRLEAYDILHGGRSVA